MTIRDIANKAGVSAATVSRILNHKDQNISKETRNKVLEVVRDSGYVPYAKIRDRLLAANNTIFLSLPTLHSSFLAEFASEIQDLAQQNGYTLMLSLTYGDPEAELSVLEHFKASKAAGILFFPVTAQGLQQLRDMASEGASAVILDHCAENAVFPQVYRNAEKTARRCTSKLLESCTHTAVILKEEYGELINESACRGYEEAFRNNRFQPDAPLILPAHQEPGGMIQQLLEMGTDGIVCQDMEAAGAVYAAAAVKCVRIPEELSVISMEDAPIARQLSPTVCAWSSSSADMARAAFSALLDQIQKNPLSFTSYLIPARWEQRSSIPAGQLQAPRIVIVGSMNMDIVLHVPHLLRGGETILATDLEVWPGGKGANQALGVSRLEGNAHLLGCIGSDRNGRHIFEQLSAAHVNMSGVIMSSEAPTGTAYINVSPNGRSSIVVHPGANHLLDRSFIEQHTALLQSARYCLIQMEIPFEAVYQTVCLCREKQIRAILKPSPVRELPDDMLQELFMLVPNEEEMEQLCPDDEPLEKKARRMIEKGVQNVIVTMGSEGCIWVTAQGSRRFSAHPFPCIDSTGASDVFISCLAVMLSEGNGIEDAVTAASWAASYSVSHAGVQNAIPDRKLLNEFIAASL